MTRINLVIEIFHARNLDMKQSNNIIEMSMLWDEIFDIFIDDLFFFVLVICVVLVLIHKLVEKKYKNIICNKKFLIERSKRILSCTRWVLNRTRKVLIIILRKLLLSYLTNSIRVIRIKDLRFYFQTRFLTRWINNERDIINSFFVLFQILLICRFHLIFFDITKNSIIYCFF